MPGPPLTSWTDFPQVSIEPVERLANHLLSRKKVLRGINSVSLIRRCAAKPLNKRKHGSLQWKDVIVSPTHDQRRLVNVREVVELVDLLSSR